MVYAWALQRCDDMVHKYHIILPIRSNIASSLPTSLSLSLSLLLLTLSMNWLHRNNHQLKCHVPCLTVCIVEWVVFTVYFNTTATHTQTEHIHFQPSHLLIASFIHPIVTDKFLYKVLNNFLSSLLASLKLPKTNINNAKALQHSFQLLLLLPLLLLLFYILFCRNICANDLVVCVRLPIKLKNFQRKNPLELNDSNFEYMQCHCQHTNLRWKCVDINTVISKLPLF